MRKKTLNKNKLKKRKLIYRILIHEYNKSKSVIMNITGFIIKISALFFISFILGIFYILHTTDPFSYKEVIENSISSKIKKETKINGKLSWTIFSLKPSIKIEKLYIKNEPWGKSKYILTANNIIASVSIRDLLNKTILIDSININSPNIELEEHLSGIKNWKPQNNNISKNINKKPSKKLPIKLSFNIQKINIQNAKIKYKSNKNNSSQKFLIQNLNINTKDSTSPLYINFKTNYNGINLDGNIKTISAYKIAHEDSIIPITAKININDAIIDIDGNIVNLHTLYPELNGKFKILIKKPEKTLNSLIKIPEIKPINVKFNLNFKNKIYRIKNFSLNYDTLKLIADLTINTQKTKPNIHGNILIPFFDIPNIFYPNWEKNYFNRVINNLPRPKSNASHIENPKAFKGIPLPISELDLLNMNINIKIPKLKAMPEMQISDIEINPIIKDGTILIHPINMNYMDGNVILNILGNNKNNTFNGTLQIIGNNINLGKILSATGYKKFFTGGITDTEIILNGYGPNLTQFMKNLNGYIRAYTKTKITGYKIENTFIASDTLSKVIKNIGETDNNNIVSTPEITDIKCIVANLNIINGNTITSRGIAIETNKANIIIDGSANLGDELLDTSVITMVKEGFKLSPDLSEIIKIHGILAEPDIIINKKGFRNSFTKAYVATAISSLLTGGISLLNIGLGYLTKSWLNNITNDKTPCKTAIKGNLFIDNKYKNTKSQTEIKNEFETKLQNTINKLKNY